MTTRRTMLALAILSIAVAAPLLVYASTQRPSPLENFLNTREGLFKLLQSNESKLPAEVEHRMKLSSRITPDFPGTTHIESVIGDGHSWMQNGGSSYTLVLSDKILSENTDSNIASSLLAHFAGNLESLGLKSMGTSASGSYETYATASNCWYYADNQLVVTLSVVVHRDTHSATVQRFVHERFD